MEAGTTLDSLVATEVFGYVVILDTQSGENYIMGKDHIKISLPQFSTDIEQAYKITEHLFKSGWNLSVKNDIFEGHNRWLTVFVKQDGRQYVPSLANSLPVAICKAGVAAAIGQNVSKS
jgi:malate/lactate dehydrogenase